MIVKDRELGILYRIVQLFIVKVRQDFNWKYFVNDSKNFKFGLWICRKVMSNLKSGCRDYNIIGEKGNFQNEQKKMGNIEMC